MGHGGDESAPCAVCGRRVDDVEGGAQWLHLEVTRGESPEDFAFLDADFCTQAHAAQWLSQPLPDPPPPVPARADWHDRLFGIVLVVSTVWAVGLMLLGSYALVRLLGGWD